MSKSNACLEARPVPITDIGKMLHVHVTKQEGSLLLRWMKKTRNSTCNITTVYFDTYSTYIGFYEGLI